MFCMGTDFMKRRVFGPLGMNRTGVGRIGFDNHATGYARSNNGKVNEAQPDIPAFGVPSGGLETSLNDLLILEASLRMRTPLKLPALTQMITPAKGFDVTPGWFARHAAGVTPISKNGSAGGFSSFFSFVPERSDAIIMLRNWQGKGAGILGPSNSILEACCGIPKHGGSEADE